MTIPIMPPIVTNLNVTAGVTMPKCNGKPMRAEARDRAASANRTAETCGRCGRALAATEPVWWVRGPSHSGNGLTVACAVCAPEWWKDRSRPGACETCGRPVGMARRPSWRVFCSERCRWRWGNAQHLTPRFPKPCTVCGKSFTAARRDARSCSHACRQRGHRRRTSMAHEGDGGNGS
jgi:predicted nucleic acid-binding Zn ribbon protein